jgi:hypothetical protein
MMVKVVGYHKLLSSDLIVGIKYIRTKLLKKKKTKNPGIQLIANLNQMKSEGFQYVFI